MMLSQPLKFNEKFAKPLGSPSASTFKPSSVMVAQPLTFNESFVKPLRKAR